MFVRICVRTERNIAAQINERQWNVVKMQLNNNYAPFSVKRSKVAVMQMDKLGALCASPAPQMLGDVITRQADERPNVPFKTTQSVSGFVFNLNIGCQRFKQEKRAIRAHLAKQIGPRSKRKLHKKEISRKDTPVLTTSSINSKFHLLPFGSAFRRAPLLLSRPSLTHGSS